MKGIKYLNSSKSCMQMISRNSKPSKKLKHQLISKRRRIQSKQCKSRKMHRKHWKNKSRRKFIKIFVMNILWIKLWKKYNLKHHYSLAIRIRHQLDQQNQKISMGLQIFGRISLNQRMDMKSLKMKRFQRRDKRKQNKLRKNLKIKINEHTQEHDREKVLHVMFQCENSSFL